VMSTGIGATMQMQMMANKYRKPMMDERRLWRSKGIVRESVKIRQYISDVYNTIMGKQIQLRVMYLKRRLYCTR